MSINLQTAHFVVIGAGETGRSIINYLNYHQAKLLHVLDTRVTPPQIAGVNVIGGALSYANLAAADVIVISPGVSIYEPVLQQALSAGKQVVGDIELFAQAIQTWPSKVIAISGSNGKTTVTSLTGFLAESAGISTLVAGNIGTPVLEAWILAEQRQQYPELIVLELSSFQLEVTYSLQCVSSSVLNISEDHLDRYRDLLEYAYVKANIFNHSQVQVLNQADPLVMAMLRSNLAQITFAANDPNFGLSKIAGKLWLKAAGEMYLATDELQLVGRHNYMNVLASLALLDAAGYALEPFKRGLTKFAGLEHRMQKVCEQDGVLFIEDSKGTNVGAVIAGVDGIDRPIHLILGGDGKGQDFTPLRELVLRKCKSVALIGQDAAKLAEVLRGCANVARYATLPEAVSACINQAMAGDAVILSPACASWDMFSNYKQRAQVFIDSIYAHLK